MSTSFSLMKYQRTCTEITFSILLEATFSFIFESQVTLNHGGSLKKMQKKNINLNTYK